MEQVQEYCNAIMKKIEYKYKLAFFVAFIIGMMCHIFVYVGHYPSYSGLNLFVVKPEWELLEGRWLSALLMQITGQVTLPFINGVIALIFFSLANVIIVRLLEIKYSISIILISCIFICSPVIAAMNYFMHTVMCFGASVFLACLGVLFWKSRNCKKNNIASVISFVLSIALYQAEISLAMVLVVVICGFRLVDGDKIKSIIKDAFRAVLLIGISLIIWYVIFKCYLLIANVDSYRDFTITAQSILYGIRKCWGGVYWFWGWGTFLSLPIGKVIAIYTVVSVLFIVVVMLCRRNLETKKVRMILFVVLLLVFPVIANYTYVVSPNEVRAYRQFFAHIVVFILPIILCEKYGPDLQMARNRMVATIVTLWKYTVTTMAVVTVFFFCVICNTAYMNSYLQYERDYSFAIRLIERIENTEGYYPGMPVVLIQREGYKIYENENNFIVKYIPGMEQRGYGIMNDGIGTQSFMNEFIFTDVKIIYQSYNEEIIELLEAWPSPNCMVIKNGKLWVLLS